MFIDRADAGRLLAERLTCWRARTPVVVALPCGGVPVGYEVARAFGVPLDILIVRKLTSPGAAGLTFGAVGEGGVRVIHEDMTEILGLTDRYVDLVTNAAAAGIERRRRELGGGEAPVVADRLVLLVDDGVITGATACAGAEVLRRRGAERIVLAVPVAAPCALARIRPLVDDIVCLHEPPRVYWVGDWYESFSPVGNEDVRRLVAASADPRLQSPERALGAPLASPG